MRILLIEDDPLLGKALETGLKQAGYKPEWMQDGESALLAAQVNVFDAIVLDINLPKLSGLEVLKQIRLSSNVPIIIMTARYSLDQKVEGLDLGADDYLVKPFELPELLARLRAIVRRSQNRTNPIISCMDVELDTVARTIKKSNEWIKLSAREYQIVALLMQRVGKIVSKSELEEQIYSWDGSVESNTIEVGIYNIRKKLGHELITTIRGVGYVVNP